MRGRKPTPTNLKILAGNPGKRTLNANEPRPKKLEVESPPNDLTDRGKKIWTSTTKQLRTCGLLTEVDANAIIRYCDIFDKWLIAKQLYDEKGAYAPIYAMVDDGKKGKKKEVIGMNRAPWAAEYKAFLKELLRLEVEFGMTPSSRSRIQVDIGEKGDDDLDLFMAGQRG